MEQINWRPSIYLIEGELDNTTPGRVTGWMRFLGMSKTMQLNLRGDFRDDVRGKRMRFNGEGEMADALAAAAYMAEISSDQQGLVCTITAGIEPDIYIDYVYIEWYSEANGRVLIELEPKYAVVLDEPIGNRVSRRVAKQHLDTDLGTWVGLRTLAEDEFSHWLACGGRLVGEAQVLGPAVDGTVLCDVIRFGFETDREVGQVSTCDLVPKMDVFVELN